MARTATSTPARKTAGKTTLTAAQAAEAVRQQKLAAEQAEAAAEKAATEAAAKTNGNGNGTTPQTESLVMPHVKHDVLVTAIKAATAGFKAALNLEIAVSCIVFIEAGDSGVRAKKELYSIYSDAGYDCKVGGEGKDYKTVSRRIGYAAQFYDFVEKNEAGKLKGIMGEAHDDAAIQTIVAHLASAYNFRHMTDVQEAAGIVPASRQPRTASGGDGEGEGGNGGALPPAPPPTGGAPAAPDTGDKGVMDALAQAAVLAQQAVAAPAEMTVDANKWAKCVYEGATLIVPVDMKPESLAELGIKLMHAANQMRGARIDVATLTAEFVGVLEAAH